MEITDLSLFHAILSLAGAVTVIGTAIVTIQKINKNVKKANEEHHARLLQEAKEIIEVEKVKLESKISNLSNKLYNLEININKDLSHIKDTQASEIRHLGEKIEALRSDLASQHTGILNILTKLLDTK